MDQQQQQQLPQKKAATTNTNPPPTCRAVNIPTEDNTIRTVVGGPLCESGLPFGHSVLTGDRYGSISLNSLISGSCRKQLVTAFHGHREKNCPGGPAGCGETVAVSVAEVISTGDDGSPTLWIGCADGSVQVYFLGGYGQPSTTQSPAPGRKQSPHHSFSTSTMTTATATPTKTPTTTTTTTKNRKNSPQNEYEQLHHDQQQQQQQQASQQREFAIPSPAKGGRAFVGGFVVGTPNERNNVKSAATASSSSFLFTAADAASTISRGGCVLIFAERKHSGAVQCIVGARSIDSAFTGGSDWSIVRWRTSYPFGAVSVIGRHSRSVRCLSFSPGNPSILLSGGDDGIIKLWSSRARKPIELAGHRGSVLHVVPWYDTVSLFGDVFSMLQNANTSSNMSGAASASPSHFRGAGGGGGFDAAFSNQDENRQKATGFVSCGDDGTVRLWSPDSQVASCVLQGSSSGTAPVVKVQIFSDNLFMAFAKDGSASVFHASNFPRQATCIYRFENVGQVHRTINTTKRQRRPSSPSPTASCSSTHHNQSSRISTYLHDVKVLAHLNGFLVWSVTSSGAKLSLLPLRHFEAATKKQLATISDRREVLEALLCETLDDADSTQSGQLLFQKIITSSLDEFGAGGQGSFLLQLAKLMELQQQQQRTPEGAGAGNAFSAGGEAHKAWNFDQLDLLDFPADDPGQLSTTEQTAFTLRALMKSVDSALSEICRLIEEFLLLKTDLQVKSFEKVMELNGSKQIRFLKQEFDALDVRRREILAAEEERDQDLESVAGSSTVKTTSSSTAKTAAALLSSKPKVNPRKQIADMLQEMFSGKRSPLALGKYFASTTTTSATSATMPFEARYTEIEKQLIDGISKSVTGEGAASYIYYYCVAKQQSVDPDFMKSQQERKLQKELQTREISSANEKLESEIANLKKQLAVSKKQIVDANAKVTEVHTRLIQTQQQVKEETSKLAIAEEQTKAAKKALQQEIARRPVEMKPVNEEERKRTRETAVTGTLRPVGGVGVGGVVVGSSSGIEEDVGHQDRTSTGPAPNIGNFSSLSLIVSTDKKLLMRRKGAASSAGGDDINNNASSSPASAGSNSGEGSAGNASEKIRDKKKKDGGKNKSDEDEVAEKKDVVGDQVIVSMPGVGSWSGAERRCFGTQTKITKGMSTSVQAEIGIGGSLRNFAEYVVVPKEQASSSSTTAAATTTMSKKLDNNSASLFFADPVNILQQQQQQLLQQKQHTNKIPPVAPPLGQFVQDSPVAGWTDQDLELIRQSEDFLGKAAIVSDIDPYAHLGGNNAENALIASQNQQEAKKMARHGNDDSNNHFLVHAEDSHLANIGDTVTAALAQLRELEKLYTDSQKSLVAFEDAAFAEGMKLNDPKISGEMARLKFEEKALAEEMRRLHYLLVVPNSPLPCSSHHQQQQQQSYASNINNDDDNDNDNSTPMKKSTSNHTPARNAENLFGFARTPGDKSNSINFSRNSLPSYNSPTHQNAHRSEHDGDHSLLKEFQSLLGKERVRINDQMFLSNHVTSPESCVASPTSSRKRSGL